MTISNKQKLDNIIDANLAHIMEMSDEDILADAIDDNSLSCPECGWSGDGHDLSDDGGCPSCNAPPTAIISD